MKIEKEIKWTSIAIIAISIAMNVFTVSLVSAEENDNVLPQSVYSYDNVIKINEENGYVEMDDYEWIYDGDITVGIKYISTEKEYRVDEGLMLNKEENLMEYKEFKSLVDEDNFEVHSEGFIKEIRHILIFVAIVAIFAIFSY